jgi:hypothetical protein
MACRQEKSPLWAGTRDLWVRISVFRSGDRSLRSLIQMGLPGLREAIGPPGPKGQWPSFAPGPPMRVNIRGRICAERVVPACPP